MFKTYRVNPKDRINARAGSGGYQPKYIVDDGMTLLKVQANIGGVLVNDWRVEQIASYMGRSIGVWPQRPCKVLVGSGEYMGVASDNFEVNGATFKSFREIANQAKIEIERSTDFNRLSAADKIRYMSAVASSTCGIGAEIYTDYLIRTAVVDILVCNIDRHFRNFGLRFNQCSQVWELAPIFDCGMGLFEFDPILRDNATFEQAMSRVYIEPYSEDPVVLIHELNQQFGLKKYLSKVQIEIPKYMCPNEKAWQYNRYIRKVIKQMKLR